MRCCDSGSTSCLSPRPCGTSCTGTGDLRILLTNITLASRSGTEINIRDIATGLLARGHRPIVYSTRLGEIAEEIRAATVPVVDDLARVGIAPDVIHGHHHPETMTALLHFPGVPAIFFCHDWMGWHDSPPCFPRIRRYVAVDDTNRDRLVLEHGIPEERVRVILNSVDLGRFQPRAPLPSRPGCALVFSHYAREDAGLGIVRTACARAGLALDVVGDGVGRPVTRPETILGAYDLVFARGRCALEALAVGAAVVLCGTAGMGPMVTSVELDRLRRSNLGRRCLRAPLAVERLEREIARYDAGDAARVSERIRATAGLADQLDTLVALYEEVIGEAGRAGPSDAAAEGRAAAAYLRLWSPLLDGRVRAERDFYRAECERLRAERDERKALLDANWWKFPRRTFRRWRRARRHRRALE